MKDKLFSIIAHDLRGPIGNNGNLLKLILDGDISDPDEVRRTIKTLYSSSESTFGLLENLLTWSDRRNQEFPYNPSVYLINPIFDETINLYSSALDIKELSISKQINPHTIAVFDQAMIRTVIRNLVNNAIKFTPRKGSIVLGNNDLGNKIEVFVQDNGIGMSPEMIGSLFNAAETTIRTGTNQEKGHGLGLMLCHEMISRHGSELNVESHEGKGTKFSFTLIKPESVKGNQPQ
jgi:signal transduction histidine kinase